jgi:PAS domain S-box-containing protein
MKQARPQTKPLSSANPAWRAVTRVGKLIQEIDGCRSELPGQRRKLEEIREQLHEASGRYQDLYELAPVGFLTLDRRGRILELNEKAARLLGFPVVWLLERPFFVFIAPTDVQKFLTLLTRSRQTSEQQTIELDIVVDGRFLPVQVLMRSSTSANELTVRMTVVDLTDMKRIETELKETLNNWYSLVHSAPDVIMTVDRNNKIKFVNRSAWGCSIRALLGTRLPDYVSEKDRAKVQECISHAFHSEESSSCEVVGVNGEKDRWFSFSFGSAGHGFETGPASKTTTVTIREISEHKRTEESLRSSREKLREFATHLEQVREDERTRVAREIHDDLGQALTILKMDLAWLQGKTVQDNDGARKKIKSMISDVDQTIERVRKIVSELRPSILDELGLIAALEWQVSQFQQRTGIRGIFESKSEEVNLPPDTAAALFRVVQEALTNIMRHAAAREVRVAFKSGGGVLRIAITDDGKGLKRQQINDLRSFGIVGMRERVHGIGGEFNIVSKSGRGTRLEITAPLK